MLYAHIGINPAALSAHAHRWCGYIHMYVVCVCMADSSMHTYIRMSSELRTWQQPLSESCKPVFLKLRAIHHHCHGHCNAVFRIIVKRLLKFRKNGSRACKQTIVIKQTISNISHALLYACTLYVCTYACITPSHICYISTYIMGN